MQVVQQRKGRWREGEIFPEGWESMGGLEKAWQVRLFALVPSF